MKGSLIQYARNILAVLFLFTLTTCRTYYQKSIDFQNYVLGGKFEKAEQVLNDSKKAAKGKDRFLYFVNQGWINHMLHNHQQSNDYFMQADHYVEDYQKKAALEALTFVSNPAIRPYAPEDFEKIYVNYYKALNYLSLGKKSEALVECRRMNIQLQQLNDKYKDHKNRYSNDAFANIMMGLIYESNSDWNNAFIAYRNALDVYNNIYKEYFGVEAPQQLKQDILRTAWLTGFYDEVRKYEKEFGMSYQHEKNRGGQLVFLWHNGLGPVKSEWSINFTKVSGEGGWIFLVNDEYGLSFPFFIGDKPDEEKSAFAKLSFLRVAFPKYLERQPVYERAEIIADGKSYKLEKAEDVNEIALKTLRDRMLREMANSLLRLATKKATEAIAREQNQDVGAAVGLINALTEKADTRNWQTLPYEIFYTRIPMPQGMSKVKLQISGNKQTEQHELEFNMGSNETRFFTFRSLESFPPETR